MGNTYHKKHVDPKRARRELQRTYGALPKPAIEG